MNKRVMKKHLMRKHPRWPAALCVLVLGVAGVQALDVDVEELKTYGTGDIQFVNYSGVHEVVDTIEEILNIGRIMAESGDFYSTYFVIRALDPDDTERLGADIVGFSPDAGVDHIVNVRRILTGYLQGAFGYERADAELLSVFITYYNAVFRGRMDDIGSKYNQVVLDNVTAANLGLALHYREWPGRTRMLIPFTREAGEGTLGALSTTELTDKDVIDEMRKDPDKGLDVRKDMVDLKEREIDDKRTEVEGAQSDLDERTAEVEQREAEVQKDRAELEAQGDSTRVASKEREIEQREQEIEREREDIEDEQQDLEAQREQIAVKEREVESEREGIVRDERTMGEEDQTEADAATAAVRVLAQQLLFLASRGREEGGQLLLIDPTNRTTKAATDIAAIAGTDFHYFKDAVVVAAYESSSGASPAVLVLIDPATLEIIGRSSQPVFPGTYVHTQSGAIYAVTAAGGTYHLGRFGEGLELEAESVVDVDPSTYITIFGSEVYCSASGGEIFVLNASDLTDAGRVAR